MQTDTRLAVYAAWVNFIDACRSAGHLLPGTYVELATLARDSLEAYDKAQGSTETITDDDGNVVYWLMYDTFLHVIEGGDRSDTDGQQ
ncbi:MAG: hypothetical protein DDT39_00036 [Firmicutes bacterium]|nr:hypothetical protein [candidate division NPL-UPA2 bacterium]